MITRLAAVGSLVAVVAVGATIVFGSTGGSGSHAHKTSAKGSSRPTHPSASSASGTGTPGTASVPILAYHVINVPPPTGGASQDLYVPVDEFTAQMNALKAGGWHAITLDQLESYWTSGGSLGSGKPIVITFDGGYASQYTNALPVLKELGWVAVANIQVSGLAPSDGGLSDSQVRGLIAAGWVLGDEGSTQTDLTTLSAGQLGQEITTERQTLRSRYNVAVNWFSYPSGRYNPAVTDAVRTAGFVGSTTLTTGWASPQGDRFLLPRLQVVGGTSPSKLLSALASAESSTSAPTSAAGI